ncbi:MAG TPA: hypothetical protein DIT89_09560 [Planctomycetaceae bacterium]|nr:hypothetical protein [Planctomycetaceae bacterium]
MQDVPLQSVSDLASIPSKPQIRKHRQIFPILPEGTGCIGSGFHKPCQIRSHYAQPPAPH